MFTVLSSGLSWSDSYLTWLPGYFQLHSSRTRQATTIVTWVSSSYSPLHAHAGLPHLAPADFIFSPICPATLTPCSRFSLGTGRGKDMACLTSVWTALYASEEGLPNPTVERTKSSTSPFLTPAWDLGAAMTEFGTGCNNTGSDWPISDVTWPKESGVTGGFQNAGQWAGLRVGVSSRWRGESPDLEQRTGMSWWRGVLRSVWSALSKEVREHVGTDHLGNKYYYVAEYKNWRGESVEPLPVAAYPGRVAATVLRGRASGVLVPVQIRGLGGCLGQRSLDPVLRDLAGGLGIIRIGFAPVPRSSDPGCPQSLPFPVAQWLGRSPYLSPSLSTYKFPNTLILSN